MASSENVGGVQKTVFNAMGAVVGRRYATDVYHDTCHGPRRRGALIARPA